MIVMQSVTVLQNIYVRQNNKHLLAYEEKQKKRREKNRMFSDGLAKLLDDDVFYDKVVEMEEAVKRKEGERENRKIAREQRVEALAAWKKQEERQKEHNTMIQVAHQEAVRQWENKWDTAKSEKWRVRWGKPKQGKLEAAIPRPKKVDLGNTDEEDVNEREPDDHEEDFDID